MEKPSAGRLTFSLLEDNSFGDKASSMIGDSGVIIFACFLAFRLAVRSASDLQIVLEVLLSLLGVAVVGRKENDSPPSTAGDVSSTTLIEGPESSFAAIEGAVGVLARGFGCFITL